MKQAAPSRRMPDLALAKQGLSGRALEAFCADRLHRLLAHPDRKDAKHRRFGRRSKGH